MKQNLFLKLLVLVTCLSSALSVAAYDFAAKSNDQYLYYNITGSSTVEVTYWDIENNTVYGDIIIPSSVTNPNTNRTYTVTAIGDSAFKKGYYTTTFLVTSVSIPSTVTRIGKSAFYEQSKLTSLTIPNSVTSLGEKFLAYCSALTSVTFGTGITEIPQDAAYRCTSLTEVVIPDQVTTIGAYAFQNCTSLTKFTIGKSVTSIAGRALDFGGSVPFYSTTALPARDIYCRSTVPPTITSTTFGDIGSTNEYNPYLRYTVYVHGPYSQSLYAAAPYWSNFSTTIPSTTNIRTLQNYDFYTGGIYYNISGSNTAMVVNKYGYNSISWYGLGDYSYRGDVTIPNTAYDSYTGKTYNVTAIGASAFCETPIMMLNNPAETPSLRDQGDLKSVTIGNNVTTIEQEAFKDCSGLTTVTLGTGVTSIGNDAFKNCTSLTTIHSNRTTPPTIQSTTFDSNHYSNAKLYVPKSAINSYKAANYWKNFYMILPNDGTELDYALNVPGGNIHFTTGNFPWFVYGNSTRVYAEANLATTPYASSVLTAEVTVTQESIVSFDYRTRTIYGGSLDPCTFAIDGTVKLSTFAIEMNDWSNFTADLPAGTHTLTWTYVPTNPTIGYTNWFAVDNVSITAKPTQTGDVNGDGQVTIADVTELIDMLLGNGTAPAAADVNGDGSVTIADVTELIDRLLGS